MTPDTLLNNIHKTTFTRKDISDAASLSDSGFKPTDIRNLIETLIEDGIIVRLSHNLYTRAKDINTSTYNPIYSEQAQLLMTDVKREYPHIEFQIWELAWFNEFLVHLVSRNMIFLDVENDGCEFVYSSLAAEYNGRMLLRPSSKEIQYYSQPDGIIIERMVTESPKIKNAPHETPLEKLIVELFANKNLRSMISQGDYKFILETMFEKYRIDQVKMLRYARRRSKKNELIEFINNNTNIVMFGE